MTGNTLAAIVRGLAPVVRAYVAKSQAELGARLDRVQIADAMIAELVKANQDLKTRVDYLEARPMPRYRKGYQLGDACEPGEMVTWKGSLWHCNESTTQKPGESHDWTLVCKRGQDGKDAGGPK